MNKALLPITLAACFYMTTDCVSKRALHDRDNALNEKITDNKARIDVIRHETSQRFDRIFQSLDEINADLREIKLKLEILADERYTEIERNAEGMLLENCDVDFGVNDRDESEDPALVDPYGLDNQENPEYYEDSAGEQFEEHESQGEGGEQASDENEGAVDQDVYDTEFIETPHK